MKKAIVFTALAFSAATLSAQYNINLSRVTPPSIEYLKMGNTGPKGKEIRVNNLYMDEGGIPQLPVMGEFHYSRMHPNYWKDALLKMKASGINIVATYCLWSLHEEMEGELSWQEHLNLRRFIQLCKEVGLKVHLRIGPYCNAEIKNGGLPDWIIDNPNFRTRSNDPLYLNYVRRWYEAIYKQVKGLLYKDGGPIMAIQLENEYVSQGMIISHLMNLKKMAVEIGFDVPLYSMTHWMDSEYPKGEIVPYAGFYIEAPWVTSGKEEMPTSNFEFFTYNRLSDNIGTDIIKIEGDVESLNGENNDSPFFTCEIGVGSATFYHRRAVVPEELAGEMINLRLGCGANLMGYYMYVGGSNPVGEKRTFQSSGPRINYDYQAPIREFGTLGTVMQETKKYNYFMNDFGTALAPAAAYLPTSNQNRNNLQWAVRLHNNSGYLFCSNYLYRNSKKDYKNVQFKVKLKDETLRIPNHKITVKDGTYFLWPFNQNMGGVQLKYATVQPICSLKEGNTRTFFFFEDDQIGGEYLLENKKMPPVCGMAYLKYHTQFGQEQLGGTHMLLLQKLMDMLCAENIFFSFYEQYKGILSLPYNAADKTTVEYYAPENSKVQIFYRHDDKEEYQSEVLSCVAGGVYAKSFSLFYGESIQYYFLEDDGKKKKKTQDASLLCNNVTPKEPQGRFDYLNDMLVSMEMHDMATMKKLMQGYCVQDYVVEQMFQPF